MDSSSVKLQKFDRLLEYLSDSLSRAETKTLNLLLADFLTGQISFETHASLLLSNLFSSGYISPDDTLVLRYALKVIDRKDLHHKILAYFQDLSIRYGDIVAPGAFEGLLSKISEEKCAERELTSLGHLRKMAKCEILYKFSQKLTVSDVNTAKYYLQNEMPTVALLSPVDLLLNMHAKSWSFLIPKLNQLVATKLSMKAYNQIALLEMIDVELFPDRYPNQYKNFEYYCCYNQKGEYQKAKIILTSATDQQRNQELSALDRPIRSIISDASSQSSEYGPQTGSELKGDFPLDLRLDKVDEPVSNPESPASDGMDSFSDTLSLRLLLNQPDELLESLPCSVVDTLRRSLPHYPFFNDHLCLESFSEEQMKEYYHSEAENILGRGSFGIVYKGFKKFRLKQVAIKVETRFTANESNFRGENAFAYIKHIFLLPVFAICDTRERFYLMYPLMEGRDLRTALKQPSSIDGLQRFRILWQLAEVLRYLHEPVENVRGPIIHADIKPSNILLDASGNIRLGDLGLSVEVEGDRSYATLGSKAHGTPAFMDKFVREEDRQRRPCNDVFSYGVLTLVLLSGQKASKKISDRHGMQKEEYLYESLIEQYKKSLPVPAKSIDELNFINWGLWTTDRRSRHGRSMEQIVMAVAEVTSRCLVQPDDRHTAKDIATHFSVLGSDLGVSLVRKEHTIHQRCHQCGINYITELSALGCSDECHKFCATCFYLSFRNPLFCPEHGRVHAPIGHSNSYGLLIYGASRNQREELLLENDMHSMTEIMTDPRIMGIRESNFYVVRDGIVQLAQAINQLSRSIQHARETTPQLPSSLILYYTGHCGRKSGGDAVWYLPQSSQEFPCSTMRKALQQLNITHVTVILDCCYAQTCNILPDKPQQSFPVHRYSRTLWAASDFDEVAEGNSQRGSWFTKHVVAGLRSGQQCMLVNEGVNECCICKNLDAKCSGDAISYPLLTVSKLQAFVFDHVQQEGRQNPCKMEISQCDHPLAYYNAKALAYALWFVPPHGEAHMCVYLNRPRDPVNEVRQQLYERVKGYLSGSLGSQHLVLERTARRGGMQEVSSSADLCRFLEMRGDLLRVRVRTVDLYCRLGAPFYRVASTVWVAAPFVLFVSDTAAIPKLISNIPLSSPQLEQTEELGASYTQCREVYLEMPLSLDDEAISLAEELEQAGHDLLLKVGPCSRADPLLPVTPSHYPSWILDLSAMDHTSFRAFLSMRGSDLDGEVFLGSLLQVLGWYQKKDWSMYSRRKLIMQVHHTYVDFNFILHK